MRFLYFMVCLVLIGNSGRSNETDGQSGRTVSETGLSLVVETMTVKDVVLADNGPSSSGDWPKWLGSEGDGISRETGWNQDWSESVPPVLWKKNVGIGFSSMAVAGGCVYTMGHRDGQEFVSCILAQSGDEKWSQSYAGKLVDNLHEGGPCATPTVDGDLLYTLGREGQLHCYQNADGKPLWSKNMQQELGVKLPAWGFSCSPLVVGEVLIVDAGRTVAFNKKTGEKIWQTAKYACGYGSPQPFQHDGEILIAVLNNDFLLVVRAEDGSEVAKTKWESEYDTNSTTPIIHDGHIFISTGYGKGCAMFSFNGTELECLFHNKELRNHMNNCVLWEGYLYGVDGQTKSSRNCTVVCMDWATGETKWKQRGMGCGSLLVADGKLLILSDSGKLVLAETNPQQYTELGSVEALSGKCWTVPVLAGGRVFCRNAAGDLVCLDLKGRQVELSSMDKRSHE